MIRCYITDRGTFGGSTEMLLQNVERNAREGVDLIQIREKDLEARALLDLVRAAVRLRGNSRILVNTRVDIALAAGANGVQLPEGSISASEWRRISPKGFLFGASCHSVEAVRDAQDCDYVFFSPVFSSPGKGPAKGIEALSLACSASAVPVLALGGINGENAASCVAAGAAGIAAIRMFQSW